MAEEFKVKISAEGSDQVKQELAKTQQAVSGYKSSFQQMGKIAGAVAKAVGAGIAVVGAAVVATVKALINNVGQVSEYGDHIDKMSQKMNVSATAYQEWDYVLQHCGSSMDAMQPSMKTLAVAAETNNKAFQQLGMTQEQVASMSGEQLWAATITALQGVESETERTYLANQLLGRGATELGPLLNMTASETDGMRQKVHELGGVMSDEAVKASARYQDSLLDMQVAFAGIKNSLMVEFMPALSDVMDGITAVFSGDSESGVALISQGINGVLTTINDKLPEFTQVASGIISTLITTFTNNLPTIVSCGLSLGSSVLDGILSAIPSISAALPQIVTAITEGLVDHAPDVLDAGLTLLEGLIDAATQTIPLLISALPGLIADLVVAIVDHAPDILIAGMELFAGLLQAIIDTISNIVSNIPGFLEQIWDAIKGNDNKAKESGSHTSGKWGEGIESNTSAVSSASDAVWAGATASTTSGMVDMEAEVDSGFTSIVSTVDSYGSEVASSAQTGFETANSNISTALSTAETNTSKAWSAIESAAVDAWQEMNADSQSGMSEMNSIISSEFGQAESLVVSGMNSILSALTSGMARAKSVMESGVAALKASLDFSWSLPYLPLPHFAVSGKFSVNPPSVPNFSVSWYERGGVFDTPTIFGFGNGKIGGLGENGAEAVVPLENNTEWLDKIADRLSEKIGNNPIVLEVDGKVFGQVACDSINGLTRQTGRLNLVLV